MRRQFMQLLFGAAIAVAAFAGPASEAVAQTQFRPSVSPWEGFYLGVHGGYGGRSNDVIEDPVNAVPYNGAGNSWSYSAEGYLAAVHAGLNWESYGLVMGLEGSFGYMAIKGDAADPASPGLDTIAAQGDGTYGDVTARIGYTPGRMLYYVEGGAAFADLGWSVKDTCTAPPCSPTTITATSDGTQSGWTAGGGIAWAFSQRGSLRLEYGYYDFGEIDVTGTSGGNTYNWVQEVTLHTVKAGVTILF
ncbi:MAG: porin family protein [Rhodospirillales bacterium]|nr:MAG: porin family protein [Rhodospirillales bacterium]